jgi:MerR family transcriptional regulator, thiopeptide resistance regulator
VSKAYRVHEFAALAGVTPKALRHYDRLGLLKPLRSTAGYRVYSEKHLARLEQIVALRFLGLPLREIKNVLDRGTSLSEALAEQRTVLQEKRQLLDRAINAIQSVEGVIASGRQPDSAVLRQLIEVITMQNHLQTMKRYYSDAAWEKLRAMRQQQSDAQRRDLSEAWTKLFREAESLLTEDPAGEKVQDLCVRWSELWQITTGGDAGVSAGIRKAWADRDNWPPELRRVLPQFDLKAVGEFIGKGYASSMKKYYTQEAWARKVAGDEPHFAQSWNKLYDEVAAALNEDPASEKGRDLARLWYQLWKESTHGDAEIQEAMKRAWKDRGNWPSPMREHIVELKRAEIAQWIGKAIRSHRPGN